MQYRAILCNTMPNYAIQCRTMQYHAIPWNTMKYHAIPCIMNNCCRSVPLPCGQFNGHFSNLKLLYFSLHSNTQTGGQFKTNNIYIRYENNTRERYACKTFLNTHTQIYSCTKILERSTANQPTNPRKRMQPRM